MPAAPEELGPDALLSRHIFQPQMFRAGELIAILFFEFPENQCESVVWQQKLADGIDGVHRLGCAQQARVRQRQVAAGKVADKTYVGARTGLCELVRTYRNPRGHGLSVVHKPREGLHHVEICYVSDVGAPPMNRADKAEIKMKLLELFSDFSDHSCPEVGREEIA